MTLMPGKSSLLCIQVVTALLLFCLVSELLLKKEVAVSPTATLASLSQSPVAGLPRGDRQPAASLPILATTPTVHEIFSADIVVHWDNLTERPPKGLRTYIDTSESEEIRFLRYGLSPVKNVCLRPNGKVVVLGLLEPEFARGIAEAGEGMAQKWEETYNCSKWYCLGADYENEPPEDALWLPGNTTHIMPYIGNVFHQFAERLWPVFTGYWDKIPRGHTRYVYVHRMNSWLEQAHYRMDRNTFMFQIAMLTRMAPPRAIKFLQHGQGETRPLCFESLMIAVGPSGRMSPQLGLANFAIGIERYRNAAFEYFKVTPPEVSLPPRPLRVTVYGRSDASRRRILNIAEAAEHLRGSVQPKFLVTFLDELIEEKRYNHSLPEAVSLMAQTDVLVTSHGASTWATIFMPRRSAIIEIYGPCKVSTWLNNTIVPALEIKHRTKGNPWSEKVASPRAGNTTECKNFELTPDFTIDMDKLRDEVQSLGAVDGPGDPLPLHWLFDWNTSSY